MPIETNEDAPNAGTQQSQQSTSAPQGGATTFTGAGMGTAPVGTGDFSDLLNFINLDQVDSTVEPYLTTVLEEAKRSLPNLTYEKLPRLQSSYVFVQKTDDGMINAFGIQFTNRSDTVSQQFIPFSERMRPMIEEVRARYTAEGLNKVRLVDARVVNAGYKPDMDAAPRMAAVIVRTIRVTAYPQARDATVAALTGTEYAANWNIYEAQKVEENLSGHGVRPRMDVAMVLNAKKPNVYTNSKFKEYEPDWAPVGVIGGYLEFRDMEPVPVGNGQTVMKFRPTFHITVWNSYVPLEGVAMLLLAAFAPTIYNTKYAAAEQWKQLGDDQPNPGLLMEDPENRGRPFALKSKEEVVQFMDAYCTQPELVFEFQDGRDAIPGIRRLASTDMTQRRHVIERLGNFFGCPTTELDNIEMCRTFELRYDGVFGDPAGTLQDSRKVDYLYVAAKLGFGAVDGQTRTIMLNGIGEKDRAQVVATTTNSFTPLYLTTLAAVNAAFIRGIMNMADRAHLTIVDPLTATDRRSFGSFLTGFESPANIGSIVSSGVRSGGLGIQSVWYN